MIAVSALALVATLGACASQPESTSDKEPAAPENDAPAQEAPEPIADSTTLATKVNEAIKAQQTVTTRYSVVGDASGEFANDVVSHSDAAEVEHSCTGGGIEVVGGTKGGVFDKNPAPTDPANHGTGSWECPPTRSACGPSPCSSRRSRSPTSPERFRTEARSSSPRRKTSTARRRSGTRW